VLTRRGLNRATLARQHLLARTGDDVATVVGHLVGLQAQAAMAPFVGLWTRIKDLTRDDVAAPIGSREIVKATLMRGTLHLARAADYPVLRSTLQPVLTAALEDVASRRGGVPDVPALVTAARELLATPPRSFTEITARLTELEPDGDPGVMRYAVRTHLPLVQVPTSAPWCFPGNPVWSLADDWLGGATEAPPDGAALVRRYLAAFGPATAKDVATWCYLRDLDAVVAALRDELVVHRDEKGTELFDVQGAPLPDDDADAPPRFLPEFDNLLLSHTDRRRFVPEEHRKRVFLPGLRVAATLLVDGSVAGTWTVERQGKKLATLRLSPFSPLPRATRAAVLDEAEPLVRFAAPDARAVAVEVAT